MRVMSVASFIVVALALWLFSGVSFAHHMGQGYGSAPDVVDNYAHGANAQSENQGGNNVGMDTDPRSAMQGATTGATNAMRGEDSNANGPSDGNDDGGSDNGSGGDSGGSEGGSGSGGSGSGSGNGAGNGRN